jgi:hypothetical protein
MTIKHKCEVQVPCLEVRTFSHEEQLAGRGNAYTHYEQPDFLRTLRALSDYHEWVEGRLMPIVGMWMEEHKSEIKATLTSAEQDDIGASVEAAYKVVALSPWWQRISKNAKEPGFAEELRQRMTPNPVWQEATKAFFDAEQSIKGGS